MPAGAKQITIHREPGFYAVFRKLIVKVDGAEVLRIKSGGSHAVTLPATCQTLEIQMDRLTGDAFDLTKVSDGDTLAIYIVKRSFSQMRGMTTIPFAIRIEQG